MPSRWVQVQKLNLATSVSEPSGAAPKRAALLRRATGGTKATAASCGNTVKETSEVLHVTLCCLRYSLQMQLQNEWVALLLQSQVCANWLDCAATGCSNELGIKCQRSLQVARANLHVARLLMHV